MTNCENCGKPFEPPPKNRRRRSCSRSCGVVLAWKDPASADKRRATITAVRRTPASRAASTNANNRRWALPGEREKLSERNKEMWAKPKMRKKLIAAVTAVNSTPEKRIFYSNFRRDAWADPAAREKILEAMRRSKGTPEARALFSQLLRERWNDPVMRAKYTAANHNRNSPEHRARLRVLMLRKWREDENFRDLCASAAEFYWSQPEAREFHSRRLKALWADPIWRMRQMEAMARSPGAVKGGKIFKHLDTATDLMSAVDAVIPVGLPDFMRADIASDITLALLEGHLKMENLKTEARDYMTAHRKMFPDKWGPISIDAPLPGTDGFTIADTLSNESEHF